MITITRSTLSQAVYHLSFSSQYSLRSTDHFSTWHPPSKLTNLSNGFQISKVLDHRNSDSAISLRKETFQLTPLDLCDCVGPVFGGRSTEWLTNGWVNNVPSLGWEDTIAYLSIPVMLVIAQSVSLRILTPPSDDPAVQQSQRILKYLPLMIGYFSLSVPAGLGVYWVINNILSTVTTGSIKEYFKRNPVAAYKIDLDLLANSQQSVYNNPVWGYA